MTTMGIGQKISNALPTIMFVFGLMLFSFLYGIATNRLKIAPYNSLVEAESSLKYIALDLNLILGLYYQPTEIDKTLQQLTEDQVQPGLSKLVSVNADKNLEINVINFHGESMQKWLINWFEVWPDATHLTDIEIPKFLPGTHIHGAKILADGSVVFNFENLGLVRMNACNEVMWKMPVRTHHSIELDDDGNFWVPGHFKHFDNDKHQYPNMRAPLTEATITKVSPKGEVLLEKSLFQLLIQNNLRGMLYLSSIENWEPKVSGDILHLNDIEVFPKSMQEGVFKHGDVMVSLRNINAVIIFNPKDWSIRKMFVGNYLRQHDPDFIDGNTISVFDNNNVGGKDVGESSRILIQNATNDEQYNYFGADSESQYYYTSIMGKHQWLDNGNLLLNSTMEGRVIEVNQDKEIVWDYFNLLDGNKIGIVEGAERLPPQMDADFFAEKRSLCSQ